MDCIATIKPLNIELSGNDLIVTLPNITLINGKKWHLLICQCLPKGTEIGNVTFITNGKKLESMNGIGNVLKTDMLCSRRRYTIVYGWDKPHIMVCGTKPSAYVPTV